MDNEEFLKLINYFYNQEYEDLDDELMENQSIIITSEICSKTDPKLNDKIADLTFTKLNDLSNKITVSPNIKIGKFLLKIQRKKGYSDLIIYETIKENLLSKVDIFKDTRFKQTD